MDQKTNEKLQGPPGPPDSSKRENWTKSGWKDSEGKKLDPFQKLVEEQGKWVDGSLDRTKAVARDSSDDGLAAAKTWLETKITMLDDDIKELKSKLSGAGDSGMELQVVDEKGVVITDEDRLANPGSSFTCRTCF